MAKILGELSYNNKTLKPIGRPVDDLKALYKDKSADYNYVVDSMNKTETALNSIPTTGNAKDEEILNEAKGIFKNTLSGYEEDGDFENKIVDTKKLANDLTNKHGLMQVQKNALTKQAGFKELKDRLDKGEISRQQYQNAVIDSERNYKGIEKDPITGEYVGNYNITPVQNYVNASTAVADVLKGFKANTIVLQDENGNDIVRNSNGNGYMSAGTLTEVKEADLVKAAKAHIASSPEIQSQFQEDIYFELQNLLHDADGNKRDLTVNDIKGLVNNSNSVELLAKLGITKAEDLNNLEEVLEGKDLESVYSAIKKDQLANNAMALGVEKESFSEYKMKYLKDWQLEASTSAANIKADIHKEQALMTINKIGTTERVSPTDMTNIVEGVERTKQSLRNNTITLNKLRQDISNGNPYSEQEVKELENTINLENRTLENFERQKASIASFVQDKANIDIDFYYNTYLSGVNDEIKIRTAKYEKEFLNEKIPNGLGKVTAKYSPIEATDLAVKKAISEVPKRSRKDFYDESIYKYAKNDDSSGLTMNNRTSDFDESTRYVASIYKDKMGGELEKQNKTTDVYTFITGDSDKKSHAMYRDYESNMNKAFQMSPENFIASGQDFTTLVNSELGVDYKDVDLSKSKVYPTIENSVDGKPTYAIEVFTYTDDKKTKSVSSGKILTNYEGNLYGQDEVVKKVAALEAAKYSSKLSSGELNGHDLTIFRKLAQTYIGSSMAGKNLDDLNIYTAEPGKALDWEILPNVSISIVPKKSARKESNGVEVDDLSYELQDKQGRVFGKDANGRDTWGYANALKDIHLFDSPVEMKEVVGSSLLKAELQGMDNTTNTSNNTGLQIDNTITDIDINKVIQTESGGNASAYNAKAGATGLMQILPENSPLGSPLKDWNNISGNVKYSDEDLKDPVINKQIGTWYLNQKIPTMLTSNNVPDTPMHRLMAYNWGIGNTKEWYERGANINQLPKETINYLQQILN